MTTWMVRRLLVALVAAGLVVGLQAQVAGLPDASQASVVQSVAPVAAGQAGVPDAGATPVVLPALAGLPVYAEMAPVKRPEPADVVLVDQTVFPITAALGPFSPKQRAEAASRKLAMLLKDKGFDVEALTTGEEETGTAVLAGDVVVTMVTDRDADFDALGRSRQKLAAAHVAAMRQALTKARNDYSAESLTLGGLKSGAALLVLVAILVVLHFVFKAVYAGIHTRRGTHIKTIRFHSLELLTEERITEILVQLAAAMRFLLTVILLYFFIPLVFSFFAPTRRFGLQLVDYIVSPVRRGVDAFAAYVPSLLVIVVVVFFTFQAIKLTRFLFREIERGSIHWDGFYPEWAMPTSRIVEVLLIAFALVIAFPYLPGSNSLAFKGVSIFLGVLLSLGSSTAIANVVAGVMLTYTRAFKIGDRVQIGDTLGDVIEKTLLATHVRTIKNVDVTVPNGLVLASHIVNYSRATIEKPLLLNAGVTVGYDVPWRRVHELLIEAAEAIDFVLPVPAPFVLQTSLDSFYISYQINVATAFPDHMAGIYSELNQAILDRFNGAGIELMNPSYTALRRGETTTVPDEYLARHEERESPRHPATKGV